MGSRTGLRRQAFAVLLGALFLASTSGGAVVSRSEDAFAAFENRCAALVARQDDQAFNGLKMLSKPEAERIMRMLGAAGDISAFNVWPIAAQGFLIYTMQGRDDFCQMVGVGVPFEEFKPAFDSWFKRFGAGFRADAAFEMTSRQAGSKIRRVAGIFLAKPLENGEFVQVHINLRPDFSDGNASLTMVRLPGKSPAARELFPDE